MPSDMPASAIVWLLAHLRNEHSRLCLVQMLGAGGPATDAALSELERQGAIARDAKHFSLTQEGRELLASLPTPSPAERQALLTAVERDVTDETAVDEARLLSAVMAGYDLNLPEAVCEVCLRGIYLSLRNGKGGASAGYLDLLLFRLERWLEASRTVDVQRFTRLTLAAVDAAAYQNKCVAQARALLDKLTGLAEAKGNRHILTLLTLGRALMTFYAGIVDYESAHALCDKGTEMLRELGDETLADQGLPFILLLHFLAGNYTEVIRCYEDVRAGARRQSLMPLMESQMGLQASSAATYLGFFTYAEGMLKSSIATAQLEGVPLRSLLYRQHLGVLYAYMRRTEEARSVLQEVLASPHIAAVPKMLLRSYAGLALCHVYEGDAEASYKLLTSAFRHARQDAAFSLSYNYPWMIELAASYARHDLPTLAELDFEELFRRMEGSTNPMMRGIALRFRVELLLHRGQHAPEMLLPLLDAGLAALERARTPLEHGLALRLRANLLRSVQRTEEADAAEREARKRLAPLNLPEGNDPSYCPAETLLSRFCAALAASQEWETLEQYGNGLAACLRRAFHAERAIVLRNGKSRLEALGLCNVSRAELEEILSEHTDFFNEKIEGDRPEYIKDENMDMLCLPFRLNDGTNCLLYAGSSCGSSRLLRCSESDLKTLTLFCAAELAHFLRLQQERARDRPSPRAPSAARAENSSPAAIVCHSEPFKACLERARIVAATDAAVLLLGETGVGKEVLAGYIHQNSRSTGPLVSVHPAALSESLFENEFFGHEKGAFTGATERKIGFCELADKGTLFIDEVGDIPMNMQIKLLRVLQEHRFTRVGGVSEVQSSFRLVAATNRNLRDMVREGTFREDLYYRIAVFPIHIPPLRERIDDIEGLFMHFADHFARRYGKKMPYPDEATLRHIREYAWPGNIRELRNAVERAVILSDGERVSLHLGPSAGPAVKEAAPPADALYADLPSLRELERRYILHVLRQTGGRVSGEGGADRILGMKRSTLYVRLREYGIRGGDVSGEN